VSAVAGIAPHVDASAQEWWTLLRTPKLQNSKSSHLVTLQFFSAILASVFPSTKQGCPTDKPNSRRSSSAVWQPQILTRAHPRLIARVRSVTKSIDTEMENQDTPAPAPISEDQPKAKEQVIDPWNVSGEIGEDGQVKPIGM